MDRIIVDTSGKGGVGKTTTIGKLASQFHKAGKKVVLGAADTFRAAAVDQLIIWGDVALFEKFGTPDNCILTSRFRKGQRVGFRMTAIDGGRSEARRCK